MPGYKFKGSDYMITMDLERVMPYGDTYNDGMIQLSFTLPVPSGAKAIEAAKALILSIGLKEPVITHDRDIGEGFTYFIAYAKTDKSINYNEINVLEVRKSSLSRTEIDALIKQHFRRKLVIVGACTGDDAHTVGIDAILSMKGVDHHYGLERYEMFEIYNLGSQIKNEELLKKSIEVKADAILISQIVTQKDSHIPNLTKFIELIKSEGMREKIILVLGGPRISHEFALKLGFDAGFGKKTYPEDVAGFIVEELIKRG